MGSNNGVKKEKAIQLRKQGKTYTEIMTELEISSKGTLSYWFKDMQLNKKEEKRLEKNKKLAQERGLMRANKRKTERVERENKEAYEKGVEELSSPLSERELLLVNIALYWGEGAKRGTRRWSSLTLSNSDPRMVRVYMKFLREILNVPEKRIRSGIYIHDEDKEAAAREYWAKITGLPQDRFFIVTVVSGSSKGKRSKDRLPFGTLKIDVNKRKLFHYMKGMIEGLASSV